jgi:hypothetical protein
MPVSAASCGGNLSFTAPAVLLFAGIKIIDMDHDPGAGLGAGARAPGPFMHSERIRRMVLMTVVTTGSGYYLSLTGHAGRSAPGEWSADGCGRPSARASGQPSPGIARPSPPPAGDDGAHRAAPTPSTNAALINAAARPRPRTQPSRCLSIP